ncbi:hypothetical protein [Leptospira kanakyensis]|uniref:hypothetical protein n=1 Tax=Leptospira kanakyensis TaxID=2484968 RepID=UPI00223CB03F|nr:hypothetical protein [Leptospira kanakyensis]MCW7471783.1 hypothetical protein [Leptospira kanakyensis]
MNLEIIQNTFTIDKKLKINRELSKREFLKFKSENKTEIHIDNPPYITYKLNCSYGNYQLLLLLFFNNEILTLLNFTIDSEIYGISWDDFSEKNEIKRKRDLEKLVKAMKLSVPIDLSYDEKSGYSSATIRYT